MLGFVKFVFNKVIDFLYPRKCCVCKKSFIDSTGICSSCQAELTPNVFLTEFSIGNETAICVSSFKYESLPRKLILDLKFYGMLEYSGIIADAMCKSLQKYCKNSLDFDYITCVPSSKKQLKERGFNQSEVIARKISKTLGIAYENLLIKVVDYSPQRGLKLAERIENVIGAFDVSKKFDVRGKKILLCDDIITTGATLKECCKTLICGGARQVLCLTACKTFLK